MRAYFGQITRIAKYRLLQLIMQGKLMRKRGQDVDSSPADKFKEMNSVHIDRSELCHVIAEH